MSNTHGLPPGYHFPRRARNPSLRVTPAGMRVSCVIGPDGKPILAEGASRRLADRAATEAAWAHHRALKGVT